MELLFMLLWSLYAFWSLCRSWHANNDPISLNIKVDVELHNPPPMISSADPVSWLIDAGSKGWVN